MHRAARRSLKVQPRDFSILAELGEVGLLDTDTIWDRHFPLDQTGQACRRRLRLFADHGLTQTIHIAMAYSGTPGRLPILHRLTPDGAEYLLDETGIKASRPGRSDVPKPATLFHRLGMVKVQLAVNDACELRHLFKPQWIQEYDIAPPLPNDTRLPQRFLLRREFAGQNRTNVITCWPDAACLLPVPHQDRIWHLAVLWEFDRATETLKQVIAKLAGYERFIAQQEWKRIFPMADSIRIFFVVPSTDRIQNIATAAKNSPAASFLRFAVTAEVSAASVLTAPIWRTIAGEHRAVLLQSSASTTPESSESAPPPVASVETQGLPHREIG